LVSDIPAGEGKISNLFLQCGLFVIKLAIANPHSRKPYWERKPINYILNKKNNGKINHDIFLDDGGVISLKNK
jgi:hypothetical protein